MPAACGAFERAGARLVGRDRDELDPVAAVDGVEQRLQVGAFAGGEDRDVHAARSFSSRPRDPSPRRTRRSTSIRRRPGAVVAEVRQQRRAAAFVAVDVVPHRPVLTPAGVLRLAGGLAAGLEHVRVPLPDQAARAAVRRRGVERDQAGSGEVADDRPDRLLVGALAGDLRQRARRSGRRARPSAGALTTRSNVASSTRVRWMKYTCRPWSRRCGEQQAAGRARRRGRRDRPPGSRPRASPGPWRGTRCARRPCRSPSRTRWWRRSPRPRRT